VKKIWIIITIVTLYLLFYQLTPFIGIPDKIISVLFIVSPFLVIAMVYFVLKYGKPSKYNFDERFYEDFDHRQ
jgi:hypothetical protein